MASQIPIENTKKKSCNKTWTKLRNGLFGWRVTRKCVKKTDDKEQTEAELGTAKTGTPKNIKLESPAKVLPGGISTSAGNSLKRKRQSFYLENFNNFGWENDTGGSLEIESERLTDSDDEMRIRIEDGPKEAQMGTIVSPNL